MRTTLTNELRIIHAIPGRIRIHLPGWSEQQQHSIETHLSQIPGVSSAQANPLTGNVLIRFDSAVITETGLLAAMLSIPSQHATLREHDTLAYTQQRNDVQMPVSPAMARTVAPQRPITHLSFEHPARNPVGDIVLSPTPLPMLRQPVVAHLHPSHVHAAGIAILERVPEPEATQVVAHGQMSQNLDTLLDRSYPHTAPLISWAPIRASEPRLPETTTVRSVLNRILRVLLAPGTVAFVLKATGVILGLARASSPLGLVLGGIELVQLLAETHERWPVFSPASSNRTDRLCMQCRAAF